MINTQPEAIKDTIHKLIQTDDPKIIQIRVIKRTHTVIIIKSMTFYKSMNWL